MQFVNGHIFVDGRFVPGGFSVEDGRFARRFRLPQGLGDKEQGAVLAAYIRAMHAGMKGFFNHLDDGRQAAAAVEKVYQDYLKQYPAL